MIEYELSVFSISSACWQERAWQKQQDLCSMGAELMADCLIEQNLPADVLSCHVFAAWKIRHRLHGTLGWLCRWCPGLFGSAKGEDTDSGPQVVNSTTLA